MARGLGTLTVWLGVNSNGFSKGLTNAQRTLQKFSRSATIAGAAIGAGLTAAAVSSVRAFMTQEDAINRLNQALKSTKFAAGFDIEQLKKFSSELQSVSTYGDDAIQSAMAVLATFTQIKGDVFKQATESALNMSAALGQDVQSSIIQLGKALNDPIKGITALSRVGVSFTEAQKSSIEDLVKAGKAQEAQQVILNELQVEFGGMARAAAMTTSGAMTKMMNLFGDVRELFGELIVDVFNLRGAFQAGAGGIEDFYNTFKSNIEGIKYFIQDIGIEAFTVGKNMVAIFKASLGNIAEIFKWATSNAGKFMTNWVDIALGVGKDYLNIWKNVITAVIDIFKSGWKAIGKVIKGGNVGDAIKEIFETAVQGVAKTIGDIGRETEKAMAAAGISELKLTGFDDLARMMAENRAAADAMKERLERAALDRINRGGAMGGAGAVSGPEATQARSGGARTESPVFAAIRRGTLEALKAENTRVNKDDKIEMNTRKTAKATERVAKGIDEVVRRLPFRGAGVVEDVF